MSTWNPWHGCKKISPGCRHCYVYRMDAAHGKDASVPTKTGAFRLPVQKKRDGSYKLTDDGDYVYTCFTSDFLLPEADEWRKDAWRFIRERKDLRFFFITKRIERFAVSLPDDWGDGYENVTVGCTCENQRCADRRLPIFLALPIRHRVIHAEPMLEPLRLERWLARGHIEQVNCGGESGPEARILNFGWVLDLMTQCVRCDVPFHFKQTGTHFQKGDRTYEIPRNLQAIQAKKAGVDYRPGRRPFNPLTDPSCSPD